MKRAWRIYAALIVASVLPISRSDAATVSSVEQLAQSLVNAAPGDVITILPGRYEIDRLSLSRPGMQSQPITLRAERLGDVYIIGTGVEIFKISAPYWIVENLDIVGTPSSEHAFHIVGDASHTIIRHNFLHDFDAMIKGNGEGSPRQYPGDVLIDDNFLIDSVPRTDNAPVTPIDVVGGTRWVIRNNVIADFANDGGNGVSYGAYLKGNSSDGLIERNLVICEWKTHGGVRVGLSLGGGGTGPGMCDGDDCSVEHRNGTIRNNIVMNCPEDVAVYLNKAKEARIVDNDLINSNGVDVRFPVSSALVSGNILAGGLRSRDGGVMLIGKNYQVGGGKSLEAHKGALWLESKIFGAAKKYPNVLKANWAVLFAGWVGHVDRWIGTSRWGRGQPDALFVDLDHGDFNPRPGVSLTALDGAVTEDDDFCGQVRPSADRSYGAIAYEAGACDVKARIAAAEALMAQSSSER